MNGMAEPLLSYRAIVDLIAATTTKTGLTVQCELDSTHYPQGIVASNQAMDNLNITRDAFHGEWNYRVHPTETNVPPIEAVIFGGTLTFRPGPEADAKRRSHGRS